MTTKSGSVIKHIELPSVYLLTAYFRNDQAISKLEPLCNTLVFAGNPQDSEQKNDYKQRLLTSDETGQLRPLNKPNAQQGLQARQLAYHFENRTPIILPPYDIVSYLYTAHQKNKGSRWQQELRALMAAATPSDGYLSLPLTRVPMANLKSADNLSDNDPYKQWYQQQNTEQNILAYIIAKTRAVVFTLNKSISLLNHQRMLHVELPDGQVKLLQLNILPNFEHLHYAILTGTHTSLPTGRYSINVTLANDNITHNENKAYKNSYRISKTLNFNIINPAGEFDVMHCDPISLTETVLTQYPCFYSHLLTPTKDRRQLKSTQRETSLLSKPASNSLQKFYTSWNIEKSRSELSARLTASDLRSHKTKYGLMWLINKALHQALKSEPKTKNTLSLLFLEKDGTDIWQSYRQQRSTYLNAIESSPFVKSWHDALDTMLFSANASPASTWYSKQDRLIQDDLLSHAGANVRRIATPDRNTATQAINLEGEQGHTTRPGTSVHNYIETIIQYFDKLNFDITLADTCRQTLGDLQHIRQELIQELLGSTSKERSLFQHALNITQGALTIQPRNLSIATAVTYIKPEARFTHNAIAFIDETITQNTLKLCNNDTSKTARFIQEQICNLHVLKRLPEWFQSYSKDTLSPSYTQSILKHAQQIHIYAETVSGLINLLIRAQHLHQTQNNPAKIYQDYLDEFEITAYVKNFLLNDGWLYPLQGLPGLITMDEFWLNRIAHCKQQESKGETDNYNILHYGLDQHYALVSGEQRRVVLNNLIEGTRHIPGEHVPTSQQSYEGISTLSKPVNGIVPSKHITIRYASHHNIQAMSTEDILQFIQTFAPHMPATDKPSEQCYSKDNYMHSMVYYKSSEQKQDKWIAFKDTAQPVKSGIDAYKQVPKTLSSFNPIRVLIVFNDDVRDMTPLTLSIERVDDTLINGIQYSTISRCLQKEDLLPNEQKFIGKIGCIFYPYFQLWDKTVFGLKPLISSERIKPHSAQQCYEYGYLSNMNYVIKCKINNDKNSEMILPLASRTHSVGSENNDFKYLMLDINTQYDATHRYLINKMFLSQCSYECTHPIPNILDARLRTAIKVGGHAPYIFPGVVQSRPIRGSRQNKVKAIFEKDIKLTESRNFVNSLQVSSQHDSLKFDNFDWKTPVSFMVILSFSKFELMPLSVSSESDYQMPDNIDWKNTLLPCVTTFFANTTNHLSNHEANSPQEIEGADFTQQLVYIGKAKRQIAKNSFSFDERGREMNKHIDIEEITQLFKVADQRACRLLDWEDPKKHSNEDERFVFVAYVPYQYESPTGKKIQSVKPFGKAIINQNQLCNHYIDYYIKKIKFSGHNITTDNHQHFSFSIPKGKIDNKYIVNFPDIGITESDIQNNESESLLKLSTYLENEGKAVKQFSK